MGRMALTQVSFYLISFYTSLRRIPSPGPCAAKNGNKRTWKVYPRHLRPIGKPKPWNKRRFVVHLFCVLSYLIPSVVSTSCTKFVQKNLYITVALVTNYIIYPTSCFSRLNQGRNKHIVCIVGKGGGQVGVQPTRRGPR